MRENFGSAAKQSASGMPSSFRYSVRSLHQSNDLVERVAAAHAFTTHSAVGGDRETLGRHVLQRLPQKIGDFFGAFDLQLPVLNPRSGRLQAFGRIPVQLMRLVLSLLSRLR
jgi:hypothetical protein